MKKANKFTVGVVMAVMIVPFFLVNGAEASRVVTYGNGATWTVNRNGGGNVSKTFDGTHGNSYNFNRSCSDGSCTHTRTWTN